MFDFSVKECHDMLAVVEQYADVGILFVRRTLQVGPLRHVVGVIDRKSVV